MVKEIGEVEPASGVSEGSAEKWRLLSDTASVERDVKKFFLYVPEGMEEKASEILDSNNIDYDGLRTYAIRDGKLVITPITTHGSEKDHR